MPPFQPELISRLQHPHASPAVASPSPSVKPGDAEACTTLNVNTPPQSRSASSTTGSAPGGVSGSTSACGYSVRLDGALSPSVSRADPVALAVSDDVAGSYASSIHASLDPADTRSNALDLLRSVSRKTKQAENTLVAQRGLLGKSKASADVQSPWLPSLAFRQPAPLPQAAGTAPSHSCEPQEDHPESITPHDALEVRVERSYYVMTAAGKPVYISPPLVSPPWPAEIHEEPHTDASLPAGHSGSPADADHAGDASQKMMTRVGVLAALTAIYAAGGDRLRNLTVDEGNITFLSRGQLLLVCVARLAHRCGQHDAPRETVCYPDPEVVTRARLEALHVQIQALLSPAALGALFKRSAGADPGRLLGGSGTSRILASALLQAHEDRALLTGAIQPARLPLQLRDQLGALLRPADPSGTSVSTTHSARPKDLLYAMLLHQRRILQIARPRRHSAHPTDIAALLNTIFSIARPSESEAEHFIPLSLPKFAPQGFVYVYAATINLISPRPGTSSHPHHHHPNLSISSAASSYSHRTMPDSTSRPATPVHQPGSPAQYPPSPTPSTSTSMSTPVAAPHSAPAPASASESADTHTHLTLCFVSADREALPLLQQWRAEIEHTLRHPGLHARLVAALPRTSYAVTHVPVPGLRHFMYKSRVNAQATAPAWSPGQSYRPGSVSATRLDRLYDQCYDALHAPSYRARPSTANSAAPSAASTFSLGAAARAGADTGAGIGAAARARDGDEPLPPSLAGPPLKMHCISTSREVVLAWLTEPFELYLALPPGSPKQAAVQAANATARWVKKHETALFLLSPPVF